MINVVTVHWRSIKWIDVQLGYLERNVDAPYRVYASLDGIDDPAVRKRFFCAQDVEGEHAEKLNALAGLVTERADPDDVLVFIDGDAFPVRPIGTWMSSVLRVHPLAAVRRDENVGDRQPHPSFCFTTVKLWRDLAGDWRKGGTWVNDEGRELTDVGGNLFRQLADAGVDWLPLLRTNTNDLHPVWFGVYGHRVYHHGAGFRGAESRADMRLRPRIYRPVTIDRDAPSVGALRSAVRGRPSALLRPRLRHVDTVRRALVKTMQLRRRRSHWRKRSLYMAESAQLAESMYARLRADPEFYLDLDSTPVS